MPARRRCSAAEQAGDAGTPTSGRKTIAAIHAAVGSRAQPFIMLMSSTAIDAAVAEVDDEDGETDRRFRRRDGQHEQREDLADEIAEKTENATRLMLTASRISSIDIRMTMTFLRLTKMPNTPSVNRIAATVEIVAEADDHRSVLQRPCLRGELP